MKSALVQAALEKIGKPEDLINMVARRVRELGQGLRPLVMVDPKWSLMETAMQEIIADKLGFERVEGESKPARRSPRRTAARSGSSRTPAARGASRTGTGRASGARTAAPRRRSS